MGLFNGEKLIKVLICGSRNFNDYEMVYNFVKSLPADTVIIEGGAKGADTFAHDSAVNLNLKIETYKADWDKHGKKAGYVRNREQLTKGKPDIVVAYSDNLIESKGTKDMVQIAIKQGTETYLNCVNYEDIKNKSKKTLNEVFKHLI